MHKILVQTESVHIRLWLEVMQEWGRLGQGCLNIKSFMLGHSMEGNWG